MISFQVMCPPDSNLTGFWGFLLHILIWIRQNPLTFLTGLMTFITALYARATTKYVGIVAEQFAAQIEPELGVTLEKGAWQKDNFVGTIAISASRNTMVLSGGDVLLRCEHGSIRIATQLTKWKGHTLLAGQQLAVDIDVCFEHSGERPHMQDPSVEGFVMYKDARNVAGYQYEMWSGGFTRKSRRKDLGRLGSWLAGVLARAHWSLLLLQIRLRMVRSIRSKTR